MPSTSYSIVYRRQPQNSPSPYLSLKRHIIYPQASRPTGCESRRKIISNYSDVSLDVTINFKPLCSKNENGMYIYLRSGCFPYTLTVARWGVITALFIYPRRFVHPCECLPFLLPLCHLLKINQSPLSLVTERKQNTQHMMCH